MAAVQCSQAGRGGALGGVTVRQQPSAARWRRPVPARLSEHTPNEQAEKHGRQGQGNGDETSLEHVPQIDTEAVNAQKLHFHEVCMLKTLNIEPSRTSNVMHAPQLNTVTAPFFKSDHWGLTKELQSVSKRKFPFF